jgi:hypothetical protein
MERSAILEYKRSKVSKSFVTILAIVSILGFISIISETLFEADIRLYIESAWMFIVGIGLVLEAKIRRLRTLKFGLNPGNFTTLITLTVGAIAIITGVLSIPYFGFQNPSFLAMKGILSVIAIVIIFIQTWIVDTFPDLGEKEVKHEVKKINKQKVPSKVGK